MHHNPKQCWKLHSLHVSTLKNYSTYRLFSRDYRIIMAMITIMIIIIIMIMITIIKSEIKIILHVAIGYETTIHTRYTIPVLRCLIMRPILGISANTYLSDVAKR